MTFSVAAQGLTPKTENNKIEIKVTPLYPIEEREHVNLQESNSTLKKVNILQQDLAK